MNRYLIFLAGFLPTICGAESQSLTSSNLVSDAMVVLRENCLSCHNGDKKKGGLRLDDRKLAIKGGDSGAVVEVGKARDSLLIKVLATEADPHMPPKKQLADKEIMLLTAWIEKGAEWNTKVLMFRPEPKLVPVKLGKLPVGFTPALSLAVSPDGKWLAAGKGSEIWIHDLQKKDTPVLKKLSGHTDVVQSLAWSAKSDRLASGGFRRVLIWKSESFDRVALLSDGLEDRVTSLVFTSNGEELIVADGGSSRVGKLHLWKLSEAKPHRTWKAHADTILDLALSSDGKFVASAGADKLAKIWSLESQKETARFEGHGNSVYAVAFDAKGTQIATAGADEEIKIWDVKTRVQGINFPRLGTAINALWWTADDKQLIAVGEDGIPRTYSDLKKHSGEQRSPGGRLRKLPGAGELLYDVAFVNGTGSILSSGHSGAVYIWDAKNKLSATLK